jgi:hypothetical protein
VRKQQLFNGRFRPVLRCLAAIGDVSFSRWAILDCDKGPSMPRTLLCMCVLATCVGCARHTPRVDQVNPYAAEQAAARERVEARGRYDVEHNPDDTMSINTMGSD